MNSFLLRAPLALLVAFPAAAQSLNVDVGSVLGVPGNGYGAAAAQPGEWNQMNDGTSMSLVGLAGQATGASVSALGANFAFWFDNTGTSGDDEQLMDDACDGPVTYTFSGLAPGDYTVYTYAWAPDNATSLSTVSGSARATPPRSSAAPGPQGTLSGSPMPSTTSPRRAARS